MKDERCEECKQELTPENTVVVTADFKVCKSCNDETESQWKQTRGALLEMGIDPDKCGWHERINQRTGGTRD